MVAKLSTTINKIQNLSNSSNSKILIEFLTYMKNNGSSERHQNNNLNVMIEFSNYFDSNTTFYDINKKEQILSFLNTKIKDSSKDPEKKWISSWNHYLTRIKLFYRWLYNKDKKGHRKIKIRIVHIAVSSNNNQKNHEQNDGFRRFDGVDDTLHIMKVRIFR